MSLLACSSRASDEKIAKSFKNDAISITAINAFPHVVREHFPFPLSVLHPP
jgi:hypothetical protein